MAAAEAELAHIQSKEGLRLKYHNKNKFPEMTAAFLKLKNLFTFMTSLFSVTNIFSLSLFFVPHSESICHPNPAHVPSPLVPELE